MSEEKKSYLFQHYANTYVVLNYKNLLCKYIVFCGILVLLAIDPNSKELVYIITSRSAKWSKSFFFQLDSIYFEIPMLVENGADGRWRSFELCHNIFLSNFSYSIRTYFLRSVSAGEWWWCLKNKLGIKQVFFKVLLYVCTF